MWGVVRESFLEPAMLYLGLEEKTKEEREEEHSKLRKWIGGQSSEE